MVSLMHRLVDPFTMALTRIEWLAMTLALVFLTRVFIRLRFAWSRHQRLALARLVRTVAQMAYLILWYPDTYEFNRMFDNLDHHFAALDLQFFGCQPALEFSRLLPGTFWSEAFNLGYWSYYPMIALLAFYVLLQAYRTSSASLSSPVTSRIAAASPLAPNQAPPANSASAAPSPFALSGTFSRVTTIIMTAFFLYYLIYIFLPVSGPQFYFQAVGVDEIMQGHFPALGTYFSSHTDMLPAPGNPDGLFYRLVSSAQATGERPTAAFPSSHIGISTIVLLLARRHAPRLLLILIPLWALLCCATVYIQAHYLIDAIAGLLTAPLILWIADKSMPMLKVQKS